MPEGDLERLHELSGEQLAAARRGDLDTLEALEKDRKRLIGCLYEDGLFEQARREPETMGRLVREILANDRMVRAALEAGMKERKRALGDLEKQSKAERAYRGVA